ncbi:MAG: NAD-dependent epimerase/dehydratase family protein [Bacteroidia bacterium]|nr:NAD-dependent epimerase/dehydratase family protein [Bacteroidia bacterium]MDW8133597.1 NAD-dependent epimerase/dehydratase family protein [Bacteroidia bacterium]
MRVLITGAGGQIGRELVIALYRRGDQILATDIQPLNYSGIQTATLDVTNSQAMWEVLMDWRPQEVFHLAAYLSARSESNPYESWQVNFTATWHLFEACLEAGVQRVFWPSSIAAFGPHTPRAQTPQYTVMDPIGIYGIAKLAGERLAEYFYLRRGLDVRSIRFPGIVGPAHLPMGGTTDFAVHMFYDALQKGTYTCYLKPHTRLPMLYIEDAIRAILELMAAPPEALSIRGAYNIQGMSFSPAELEAEIQKRIPHFRCVYEPDFRQALAESWPETLDDSIARKDWGWKPQYDLYALCEAMWKALPLYT